MTIKLSELKAARAGMTVTAGAGSECSHAGVISLPYLDGVQHAEFPQP